MDPQRFGPENRGTYSLGGQAEAVAMPWKVDMARAALPGFDVIAEYRTVTEVLEALDAGTVPWMRTVLTALDSPEARREAQRLWPDRLIDAGTGDTMVGIHDCVYGGGPCLRCIFPQEYGGPSAAQRLAEATGLSIERAMRGNDPLTDDDLATLDPDQQERLRPFVGKPVCGLAQAIGLTSLDFGGYQPSIPFASLQAACLALGRLVGHAVGAPMPGNLAQYDSLFGPQAATIERMQARPGCTCQTRSTTIDRVRARRAAHHLSPSG